MPGPILTQLAAAHGVATDYWSFHGEHVHVSATILRAVLAAMGVAAATEEECQASLVAQTTASWRRPLPFCIPVYSGEAHRIPVHVPHGSTVALRAVHQETGEQVALNQIDHWVEPRTIDGVEMGEASFVVPPGTAEGWYTLHATIDDVDSPHTCDLALAPPRAPHLNPGPRGQRAGLMSQMYATRSATSWGIGDFSDTVRLASWAHHQHGCDFILINPIHAAEPVTPIEPSPYLPSSRQFLNPIYLSVLAIPEYATAPAAIKKKILALAEDAQRLNATDFIDRNASWHAKKAALELLFHVPPTEERAAEFAAFIEAQGERLRRYTVWCVLAKKYGVHTPDWPAGTAPHVTPTQWTRADEERARFHAWLQWNTMQQVDDAHQHLLSTGMSIGLINDLAVGVNPAGCDTWSSPHLFASHVSVGAPPDMYNEQGQDWSQPPWIPSALHQTRYAEFRHLVDAMLEHAGGLRIDHILGFFRLWWIPNGAAASQGTYVHYDVDMFLAVLLIAAHRRGSVLIGEDLGNVGDGVRDLLQRRGILGCSVLWFEYDDHGNPRHPHQYRTDSMVTVTTHDLPPTMGYLQGSHVRTGHELGIRRGDLHAEMEAAHHAVHHVLSVAYAGEVPDVAHEHHAVALHRFVAQTPSLLAGVYVPDLVADQRSINVPGTYREYPNWCVPVSDAQGNPVTVDDIMASDHANAILRSLTGVPTPVP